MLSSTRTSSATTVLGATSIQTLANLVAKHSYSQGRDHTHTYFGTGGTKKLSIPEPERELFYRAYQRYVETTDKTLLDGRGHNSITEKSMSVNFMFADLDLKLAYFEEQKLTLVSGVQLIRDIIDAFYQVVGEALDIRDLAYPITAFRLFYKCHIYFPGVAVSQDLGKQICQDVERRLSDKYPWLAEEKVIDSSVYKSGLRILGSHKGRMGKSGGSVQEAHNHQAFFGDSIPYSHYYRIGQLRDDGTVVFQNELTLEDLQETSIICPANTRALSMSSRYAASCKGKGVARKATARKTSRKCVGRSVPIVLVPSGSSTQAQPDADSENESQFDDDPLPRQRETGPDEDNSEDENDNESDADDSTNRAAAQDDLDQGAIERYLRNAFDLLRPGGINLTPTIHSIKRYENTGAVCAILAPQPCPFLNRPHRRTDEREVPAVFAVLTPLECHIKCHKCDSERIQLAPPDQSLATVLRFNPDRLILESLREPCHENVSELIFQLVKDQFAATPMSDGGNFVWHFYDSKLNRWIRREQIIAAISNRHGPVNTAYRTYVQKAKTDGSLDAAGVKRLMKRWGKLRFNLGTTGFIRGGLLPLLARKLDYYWTHEKAAAPGSFDGFMSKLDGNPQVLGFNNGVWDFSQGIFRPGCPSDFISMSTHVDYVPYDDIPAETRAGLEAFLRKIFPSEECLMYTLKEIASALNGTPLKQRFFIMTGAGANGKSTLVRLLNLALGDYAGEVNITLFTHTRPSADRPTPEIIQIKGKRFVSCSEPNAGDPLYLGTVKWVTGGDRIVGRALHENNQSFYLQATFFCLTNDIPPINATPDDFGAWRRIKPICFTSRFVENPDPNNAHQKQSDPRINEHLECWKSAFVSLLVKLYLESQDEPNLFVPAEFTALWQQLQNRNDVFRRFVDALIIRNEEEFTATSALWETFTDWKRNMQIRKNVPFDHFEKHMEQILGPQAEHMGRSGWRVEPRAMIYRS